MRLWLLLLISLLTLSAPMQSRSAFAQSGEIVTPDRPLADAALEARARKLMKEIRCVVCQSQSIDESDAGIAHDMRQIVRAQIESGKSDAEIRDYLTERYGDFVLLKPPFKAVTLVLWLGPFILIVLAGFGIYAFYRRPAGVATTALTAAERERLAAFMKEDAGDDAARGGRA